MEVEIDRVETVVKIKQEQKMDALEENLKEEDSEKHLNVDLAHKENKEECSLSEDYKED